MQIHELNNYSGNLDSNAYLAIDDGSDTGKVSVSGLLADTNAEITQLDTDLNGRIDNIIAGGTAPSASEIVDARRGADGVDYASLGTAIRTQFTDLKSDLLGETSKDGVYKAVNSFDQYTVAKYYDTNGNEYAGGTGWKVTPLLPCFGFRAMSFDVWRFNNPSLKIASVAFFDKAKQFISGVYANYLPTGQSEFVGQCAIPDDAYYYSVVTSTGNQSYTPNVTLYKDSVEVDLTDILTSATTCYKRDGTIWSGTGWYTTQFVPIKGFKSLSFVGGSYHSGDMQLETVTFFDSSGARMDGVFTAIPNNVTRNSQGTVPVPPNAEWAKVLYNSSNQELPKLILHNPEKNPINILCIGDSLTEGIGASSAYIEDNYPKNMQKCLGIDYTVLNTGVGGSQAVTWWNTWKEFLNLKEYNTDVIIIMLGANGAISNDFATAVDAFDDYNDYTNNVTGRTCSLIEWLQEQLPNAEIVLATPTYVDATLAPNNAFMANRQCEYMYELVNRYHLPVIDIRNLMGINPKNSGNWLASDGLHGTEPFYQKLGMLFANQIKPIINIPK